VIFAVDDGTIILNSQNKDTTALIIQHENGFISVYNFSGGSDKKVNEKVSIGEKIGVIDKNSEICLQVFSEGQKIMANNLFIN
jgi:septal ring factor EnvC (AmiA/AmiB activator)